MTLIAYQQQLDGGRLNFVVSSQRWIQLPLLAASIEEGDILSGRLRHRLRLFQRKTVAVVATFTLARLEILEEILEISNTVTVEKRMLTKL